jgi:glycosyltransferase involved in cell wall biosynthesis/HEPN domain-containing protein
MINIEMAEDYIERAKRYIREAERAFLEGDFPTTVRRSQEALELGVKAVLRYLAIEYPREHDVGDTPREVLGKVPEDLERVSPKLKELFSELARARGPAMYGYARRYSCGQNVWRELCRREADRGKRAIGTLLAFHSGGRANRGVENGGGMKIIQVCPRYYPDIGGVETHVKEISERLVQRGFEVEVVCTDRTGKHPKEQVINGVAVRRFRALAPHGAYFFAPQIGAYLRRAEFDIIHAHNYHAFPAYFASFVKRGTFIFTPHYHGMGSTPLRNVLNKPYKLLGARIFTRADKVICVSEYEKALVMKNFKVAAEETVVIPNGINLEELQEARPFEFDHDLILYVGRLEKYKNIHIAIRAMEFLPERHFYIIGDGGYKKDLERLITSLHLENRVKILSGVSDTDKYRWLKTCSLFINLSGIEAFGMTVLEALAVGKPVVVNGEGGLREFAQNFVGVVPVQVHKPADRGTLKKLAKIVEEKRGGQVNEDPSTYTWDSVVKRIEGEYCNVTKK